MKPELEFGGPCCLLDEARTRAGAGAFRRSSDGRLRAAPVNTGERWRASRDEGPTRGPISGNGRGSAGSAGIHRPSTFAHARLPTASPAERATRAMDREPVDAHPSRSGLIITGKSMMDLPAIAKARRRMPDRFQISSDCHRGYAQSRSTRYARTKSSV